MCQVGSATLAGCFNFILTVAGCTPLCCVQKLAFQRVGNGAILWSRGEVHNLPPLA